MSRGWWGLCAAAGTPRQVLQSLSSVARAIVASPDYRWQITRTGSFAVSSEPETLALLMKETVADIRRTMKDLGITQLE